MAEPALVRAWRRIPPLFWVLLASGLLLRVVLLGRASYMIDEINVVRDAVSQPGYTSIYRTEIERFNWYHRLPMLMFVIRAAARTIGFAGNYPPEGVARIPFALLGTLALPFFFLLGRAVKNAAVGFWCMFLAAFSVFFVYYSREAYDYAMVIFFVAGVLWTGLELIRRSAEDDRLSWPAAAAFALLAAGLLQSHMSGLLFLASWNLLMVFTVFRAGGVGRFLRGGRPVYWIVTFGAAYLLFLPFLLRLLQGGFTTTETPFARRFSLAVFPALLGRMGWGEGIVPLLLFTAFVVAGIVFGLRSAEARERRAALALSGTLLVYFAIQSWSLRVGRFETRYYSALYPLLIVFAALGIERAVAFLVARAPAVRPAAARGVLAVALLAWLAPSLFFVCTLNCRGYNYKGIAEWINRHVPPGGIYAFYNVYELRGVPNVYPTPDRFGTSVAVWSTGEDFERVQPPKRAVSFFTRFPTAFFVEIAPDDLLVPETGVPPIPRERLFLRQEWIEDDSWSGLMRLKTFPPGETQINVTNAHRVLISYNLPEDLAKLAELRGERFYRYFGPEWRYYRDQQVNDWMVVEDHASLRLGDRSGGPATVDLTFQCAGVPRGCRVSIYSPAGMKLLDKALVPAAFHRFTLGSIPVPPGEAQLMIEILPPPSEVSGALLVFDVTVSESAGAGGGHEEGAAAGAPRLQPGGAAADIDNALPRVN